MVDAVHVPDIVIVPATIGEVTIGGAVHIGPILPPLLVRFVSVKPGCVFIKSSYCELGLS